MFPTLFSTEKWMASEEMKKLNPLGGYSKLKHHLEAAHDIPDTKMSAFNEMVAAITERVFYDYLQEDIR